MLGRGGDVEGSAFGELEGGNDGIVTYDSAIEYDNIDSVTALALDGQGRILAGVFMTMRKPAAAEKKPA